LQISVRSSIGTGPTELSAFDHALRGVGIHNFNLIRLSSVIPPGSVLEVSKGSDRAAGEWGDRLYVVYAEQRRSEPLIGAWAGVGWVQKEDGSGLLVEHEGESEEEVQALIEASLNHMTEHRGGGFGPIQMHVIGQPCDDKPVCALVAAIFRSESW